ncbi:MAG: hypothetical protein AAFV53_02725 [Myxococcota bacterium]
MPISIRENQFIPLIKSDKLQRLTSFAGEGVEAPINPEVKKATEDILSAMKYSFTAAAALPEREMKPGSVEDLFHQYIRGMSADRRTKIRARAKALVEASAEVRAAHFGRYGALSADDVLGAGFEGMGALLGEVKLDPRGLGVKTPMVRADLLKPVEGGFLLPSDAIGGASPFRSAGDLENAMQETLQKAQSSGVMNRGRLEELYGMEMMSDIDNENDDLEGQAVLHLLRLEISQVRCIDETNPEFWGSDEIAIGGTSVDETGDVKAINEIYVGGGFDDGDAKNYSPYMRFHYFNVLEGKSWPKKYSITMLLAEKDSGGFQSVLNKLYGIIRDELKKKIGGWVGTALEPYLGPFISQAIGAAVAWAVDWLINWFIGLFGDDVFRPVTVTMNHVALNARFTINGRWGYSYSPWRYAYFSGHGGRYRVTYRWRLYN